MAPKSEIRSRFRMNFNYRVTADQGEHNDEVSMTTPDMSLSVQEIMRRHQQGRPIPTSRPMYYAGDDETPAMFMTLNPMDQQDLATYAAELQRQKTEELRDLEKRAERRKNASEEKQQRFKQIDLLEAIQAALSEQNGPNSMTNEQNVQRSETQANKSKNQGRSD